MKKVALGMSGGVDSSVCAALLKEQGYDVTGVFLECWRSPGCRAEEDRKDALNVALALEIPFKILDFKDQYKDRVVEYFFNEYEGGRTPNPDVLCNKEIKFGLFYDWAMKSGYDYVATGHYAQIKQNHDHSFSLAMSADTHKDQTYFLYRLRSEQLPHILFPIGGQLKPDVRNMAKKFDLLTATKPDSQGICFIGEINVHEFLRERLGEKPGDVVDTKGRILGRHKGLWFYTIGQRHGFTHSFLLPKDLDGVDKQAIPPFYVISKNFTNNQLIVGFGAETYCEQIHIEDAHWVQENVEGIGEWWTSSELLASLNIVVRIRHTGALIPCVLSMDDKAQKSFNVVLSEPTQGIASGQSAVFYWEGVCLGGGIIS